MAAAELGPVSLGVQGMAHCPAQSCQDLAAGFGRSGMALTRGGERETDRDRNTESKAERDRNCNKQTQREAEIEMEVETERGRKQPARNEEG